MIICPYLKKAVSGCLDDGAAWMLPKSSCCQVGLKTTTSRPLQGRGYGFGVLRAKVLHQRQAQNQEEIV